MTVRHALILIPTAVAVAVLTGCSGSSPATKTDTKPTEQSTKPTEQSTADPKVKSDLDKLSPEDRKLAEEQKSCPISGDVLGAMGVPVKITLKDQTVFLCCAGCKKQAEADPDKTLKAVADAKAKTGK